MDWVSSCAPQPNSQSPPTAQAPKPTGVMARSEFPSARVFIQGLILTQAHARFQSVASRKRTGLTPAGSLSPEPFPLYSGPVGTLSMTRRRMRLQFGQRPKVYDRSAARGRAPGLTHGSAQLQFRQRICQPEVRFRAPMTFPPVVPAVESPALMSPQFLDLSRPRGELFLWPQLPGALREFPVTQDSGHA